LCLTGCKSAGVLDSRDSFLDDQDEENTSYKTILYEVLPTDTITSISRKYSISAQQLIMINSLKKPYYLKPGQLLKVPVTEYKESNLISEVDDLDKPQQGSRKEVYIVPRKQ